MLNVYEMIDQNKKRTFLIMVVFIFVITGSVYFLSRAMGGGLLSVGLALIVSGLTSYWSYYYSDKIILALSDARPATRQKDFKLFTVTENLAIAAQLPMPKLYVIQDSAMNAFATGRDPDHAVVCATTGIIDRLDRTELEGVIAHELSHIKNYDIRLQSIVVVLVGLVTLLADWFLRSSRWVGSRRSKKGGSSLFFVLGLILAILSPIIAKLMQLALTRSREYLADASAAKLTRFPEGLARALEKTRQDKEPLEVANKATAHLYITNPLKNRHDRIGMFASFFKTHPPIEERIERLRGMM